MANILIVAEHDDAGLNASTAKCVTCAGKFSAERVDVAVFGADATDIAEQAAALAGVTRVLSISDAANRVPIAAILAPQIAALAGRYTHVLGPSSTFGKDLMPRVAALLGVGQLSDIMEVEGNYCFKRPIYAGNAIVTVESPADVKLVATVRTASFAAAETASPVGIESVEIDVPKPAHTRFLKLESGHSTRPDLQSAARVVSGGRGVGSAEDFDLINQLADSLTAAVGASRAAVDAGFVPNDMQVGQTGKIIAPELYIAIGISGAIQHLTGIKDAGTIVAINKDADAPIFDAADIGLTADLFQAVPELIAAIRSLT